MHYKNKQILLYNIFVIKFNLPNELISKIIYEFFGIQHKIAYNLYENIKCKYFIPDINKKILFDKLDYSRKKILSSRCKICNQLCEQSKYIKKYLIYNNYGEIEHKSWTYALKKCQKLHTLYYCGSCCDALHIVLMY